MSHQYHHRRSEVWTIVQEEAIIILEGVYEVYKKGRVAKMPFGAKHRIQNQSDEYVVIIEVQLGSYFDEDDIVRIEDDYNRS